MSSSQGHPQLVLEIPLVDLRTCFRGARWIGDGVEFHDGPAAEMDATQSLKHGGYIHAAAAKLDETVRALLAGRKRLDILKMEKQEAVAIGLDGLHGIAATLEIVSDIEFQLQIAWIARFEDLRDLLRMLAERTHVIVVAQWNAKVGCALAELAEQSSKLLAVCSGNAAIAGAVVGNLQINSAGLPQEFCVRKVLGNFLGFRRVDIDAPARQGNKVQFVLLQKISERSGRSKFRDAIRAKLNARKAKSGNIFDCLAVVPAPRDGSVAELDFSRRRRNW